MTPHAPVMLVSCTHCRRLHVPLHRDVANPLCARCAGLPAAPGRTRARVRTRPAALPR